MKMKMVLIFAALACFFSVAGGQEKLFDIADQSYIVTWDDKAPASAYPRRVETLEMGDLYFDKFATVLDDGTYLLSPYPTIGKGYIGHQWYNKRFIKELYIEFKYPENMPETKDVTVTYWIGESAIQGYWSKLPGELKKEKDGFRYVVGNPKCVAMTKGTYKVRWCFSNNHVPFIFTKLQAFTKFDFKDVELKISCDSFKGRTKVGINNGKFVGGKADEVEVDLSKENDLTVNYAETGKCKIERAVLCFDLPEYGKFAVAVEDVLKGKCVYVKGCGLYIRTADGPSPGEFKAFIAGRKTILEQVREREDQYFENVIGKTHSKITNGGPAMLSLACNNNKFVIREDGSIRYFRNLDAPASPLKSQRGHFDDYRKDILDVTPWFGSLEPGGGYKRQWPWFSASKYPNQSRSLEGLYYPAPLHTVKCDGVTYKQKSFVAEIDKIDMTNKPDFSNCKSVFVSRFVLENNSNSQKQAFLKLAFEDDIRAHTKPAMTGERRIVLSKGDLKLALVDCSGAATLRCSKSDGEIVIEGTLKVGQCGEVVLYIPGWDNSEAIRCDGPGKMLSKMKDYWDSFLAGGAAIEVPEKRLDDLIKASRINCSIVARNEFEGKNISPWCSGAHFGVIESESQSVIEAMSLMGHEEFATKALDFFIRRYDHKGKLTNGYTVMGMGWHQRVLSDHFLRYKNRDWFRANQDKVAKMCEWIFDQQEATKMVKPDGEKVMEYGLMPPGTAADWGRLMHRSRVQAEFYAGLNQAGKALKMVNYPKADCYIKKTKEFKKNIIRSYEMTKAKSPAVGIGGNIYVPYCPTVLTQFGNMQDIANFGMKDCSMGAQHLVVAGVLAADDKDGYFKADRLENIFYMEKSPFYSAEDVKADWFNRGGYYRSQPYYPRILDVYALNDDVKPFVRSYFNYISPVVNLETLTFWEHVPGTGGWNKAHETGWFLYYTRKMLVDERDGQLWLAPFVTNYWMGDGKRVVAKDMPTSFGEVSYVISSHVDDGYIEAEVILPKRSKPDSIFLRLRHPQEKKMKSVTVNGKEYKDFDAEKECIRLKPTDGKVVVKAQY